MNTIDKPAKYIKIHVLVETTTRSLVLGELRTMMTMCDSVERHRMRDRDNIWKINLNASAN